MIKRLFALLTAALCILSGCSAKPEAPAQDSENGPVRITVWAYDGFAADSDLDEVIEVANRISEEKIGVVADWKVKTEEQFTLDMSVGEYYDMTFSCSWCNNFDSNALNGYFMDITDRVREVTPALYDAIDPWWDIATVKGRIYGVPTLKDLGAEVFLVMNSDYFEGEKGMEIPESMDLRDVEPYLAAWKEDNPDRYPLFLTSNGVTGLFQSHERIAGKYLVVPYKNAGTETGTTIVPVWEDEDYMEALRLLHRWYEMGFINPDAATSDDGEAVKNGPVRTGTAWTGYKGWINVKERGFHVKASRFIGPNMSRATMQGSLFGINAAATDEKADACLKYIELMYTDTQFRDTLAYGIEGKHFDYVGGTVIKTKAALDGYNGDNYLTGPAITATVQSSDADDLADPDTWKKVYEGYKDARINDTDGFVFDGTPVEAEVAACNAIWSTYISELGTGTIDPDSTIEEMKPLLEAAGMEKIRAEAQRQLDEYLESRK